MIVFALVASPSPGQVSDHLKCYKIKDPVQLKGVVDLDSPQFGLEPGCTISKTKLFCVPATKTVLSAENRATGTPISPLPVSGPNPGDRICYKIKCLTPGPANQVVTDQFGTRTLREPQPLLGFKADLLCVPAVKGTAFCGDGAIGPGEDCEGTNLNGATCQSLGFDMGALACGPGCFFDTGGCGCGALSNCVADLATCQGDLGTCQTELATAQAVLSTCEAGLGVCQSDLATCQAAATCGNGVMNGNEQCDGSDLGGATCVSLGYTLGGTLTCTAGCGYDASGCASQAFPATGQTTAYAANKNDGIPGPVAVADDGTVQAGATLAYTDNGDGTITDLNTGLSWEKKSDDGGLHDQDTLYVWSGSGIQETVWDWLDDVNAEGGTGFAGFSDWRIPNVKELESIVDFEVSSPSVSPAFNAGCTPGCTVTTCSCTAPSFYWTSTTVITSPGDNQWFVNFNFGAVNSSIGGSLRVRAVRGGS